LCRVDPAGVEGDFFRAADAEALPGFECLDVVGGLEQGFVGAGIEPCETAAQDFDSKRLVEEIGAVDVGDFEFAAC
jgi:hypothetical protein